MTSFKNLKKSSGSVDKLTKELEKLNSPNGNSGDDERLWKPDVDKAGNGFCIIRFLPAPAVDGDDALPWVRIFDHGFQGPGGWYIENSLTTIGQPDPASEHNSVLWNSGIEANKEIARKQKRRLKYVSNVLIIQDSKHPEHEGQIKLFKYGKKIFDKITEAMNPPFPDKAPINPYDFWAGANFKLKIRKFEGYQNYDLSEFEASSALFDGDDAKLEALWQKEYSLKEFHDAKNFKSYEELSRRLNKALGLDGRTVAPFPSENNTSAVPGRVAPQTQKPSTAETPKAATSADQDDDEEYFRNLAKK